MYKNISKYNAQDNILWRNGSNISGVTVNTSAITNGELSLLPCLRNF